MAQSSQKSIDETLLFRNEISGGYFLHPRGMGFNFKQGNRINDNTWRVFNFDFLSMKHPKEFRVRGGNQVVQGSYIYGKLNNLYIVRGGVGLKKIMSRKFYHNTIVTALQVEGGPVFGLLKPVYLDILHPTTPDNLKFYRTSERYDPAIHTNSQVIIIGNSSFGQGLGELKAKTGLYLKASMMLDWSDFPDHVQSVELGATIDMFPKALPIMAFAANKKVYTTLYICINIGNRW